MIDKPKKDVGNPVFVNVGDETKIGVLLNKRCWQCKKRSLVRVGSADYCLNQCGPEALGRMLRF